MFPLRIEQMKINLTNAPVEEVGTTDVLINALCAYRDKLIMSGIYERPEVQAELTIIQATLRQVCNEVPR